MGVEAPSVGGRFQLKNMVGRSPITIHAKSSEIQAETLPDFARPSGVRVNDCMLWQQ
jgi:hypothetical protein